jgi:hypothetical protein
MATILPFRHPRRVFRTGSDVLLTAEYIPLPRTLPARPAARPSIKALLIISAAAVPLGLFIGSLITSGRHTVAAPATAAMPVLAPYPVGRRQ